MSTKQIIEDRDECIRQFLININGLIEQYGHTVMGIGAGEDTPAFNYSVGASKHGFELIIKGINLNVGKTVINGVLRSLDYKVSLGEYVLSGYSEVSKCVVPLMMVNDEPMRYRLVEVEHNDDTPVAFAYTFAMDKPFKLYEIQFADKNNKLEGEEGYDMDNSKWFSKPISTN